MCDSDNPDYAVAELRKKNQNKEECKRKTG